MLTVPLLALAGVGGTAANGTNRVAVLVQNVTGAIGFARKGVLGFRNAAALVLPLLCGALIGSLMAAQIPDEWFERVFGLLMLPLLYLTFQKPTLAKEASPEWPRWLTMSVIGVVGFYGGAVQAGVGLLILLVLARSGYGLVEANAIKTLLILAITIVALPVFLINDQVRWLPGLVLSIGMGVGGYLGASLAVTGGERLIRPVLVVVVGLLASRMLGLWG